MNDHQKTPRNRKNLLKEEILSLHKGADPEIARQRIASEMGKISYAEVVQVEQELIAEGLPVKEITDLCDVHSRVLEGQIDLGGIRPTPPGHPVHTFIAENNAVETLISDGEALFDQLNNQSPDAPAATSVDRIYSLFRLLYDVDKHYRRKENLLFPFMEKHGITGPPKVMWGKHDQIRAQLKEAILQLGQAKEVTAGDAAKMANSTLRPAMIAVADMIMKETKILLPMCLDVLESLEWFEIARQSPEIGFCLYDPKMDWVPEDAVPIDFDSGGQGRIVVPTGSLSLEELMSMLKSLPVDLTFVDKNDIVRFYSHGPQPIFDRNRAALGRQVQLCHPPTSVHVVDQILDDFRNNRQDRAEFWINFQGKFVHIAYYAVRGAADEYLGTVEMTMDISRQREFKGEQRLLDYETGKVR